MPDPVTALVYLFVGLLGLAVGSFTNVLIYRIPKYASVVHPGSRCPNCETPIRYFDNIPILSYLLLRGRCRSCRWSIPIQYPLVEAAMCGLYLLALAGIGWNWQLVPVLVYLCVVVALSVIDLKHRLLPDALTYPSFVLALLAAALGLAVPEPMMFPIEVKHTALWTAGLIGAGGLALWLLEVADYQLMGKKLADEEGELEMESEEADSWLTPATIGLSLLCGGVYVAIVNLTPGRSGDEALNADFSRIVGAYAGAAISAGVLWFMRLGYFAARREEGTGFGDVKMMLFVGAFLGWRLGFLTLLIGSLLGSVVGVAAAIRTRDRRVKIPFGIFLGAAAIVSLFLGTRVLGWYFGTWVG